MMTNKNSSQELAVESKQEGSSESRPLKLALRAERLKNLGVRSGLQTGGTCTSCSEMLPRARP